MTAPTYRWQPTSLDIAERLGVTLDQVVRFDQNTSPLRPEWTEEVAEAPLRRINEYPFADYRMLREKAARYCGVSPDWVVPGAGADELISLCAGAFLPHQGLAVSAPPTYGLYAVVTAHREARLWPVPRLEVSFALDVPAMVEAAAKADLVWLCVPNNPTGNRDDTGAVVEILEAAEGTVILDAAYAEFAGDAWGAWVERYPNLVVLRTLSKAFSLAGIRVGYAVAQPDRIAQLDRRRPPGSVSSVSAALAEHALERPEWSAATIQLITAERRRLAGLLEGLGLEVYPSVTNFVLVRRGPDASDLADRLMWDHGVVVRTFPTEQALAHHLRITVRSPAENDRLIGLLKGILS